MENTAELFVVPKQAVEQSPEPEPTDTDLRVSGNVNTDMETALRAIAFLLDFIDSVGGAEGLRACADDIREFQVKP